MLSITLDDLQTQGLYRLCILAAQRAKSLAHGALPEVYVGKDDKITTVAIKEVLAGYVEEVEETYDEEEAAV